MLVQLKILESLTLSILIFVCKCTCKNNGFSNQHQPLNKRVRRYVGAIQQKSETIQEY